MMSVVTARSAIAALRGCETRQVPLGGVAAPHRREDTVAARLQRQVELLADRRRLGHRRDRLGSEVLRMRAREPDTADAGHLADGPEQVGEQRPRPGGALAHPSVAGGPAQGGVAPTPPPRHLVVRSRP